MPFKKWLYENSLEFEPIASIPFSWIISMANTTIIDLYMLKRIWRRFVEAKILLKFANVYDADIGRNPLVPTYVKLKMRKLLIPVYLNINMFINKFLGRTFTDVGLDIEESWFVLRQFLQNSQELHARKTLFIWHNWKRSKTLFPSWWYIQGCNLYEEGIFYYIE